MLTKNQIKFINTLKTKKGRAKENLFIVEGEKLIQELLNSNYEVYKLYGIEDLPNVDCTLVSMQDLKKISALTTPNKYLALVECKPQKIKQESLINKTTLLLDDIKDPGNLGTIIRIADWFGIENIVCSQNSVDVYNNKVVQSTMGSIFRTNVYYEKLDSFIEKAKNNIADLTVFGAHVKGERIENTQFSKTSFIVMGSESHGISNETKKYINKFITIPKYGKAESLNVAVATGIICSYLKGQ